MTGTASSEAIALLLDGPFIPSHWGLEQPWASYQGEREASADGTRSTFRHFDISAFRHLDISTSRRLDIPLLSSPTIDYTPPLFTMMERLDRPGLPPGSSTQVGSRGLPENPAQGRRLPMPAPTVPVPPIPLSFSSSNLSSSALAPPPPMGMPLPRTSSSNLTAWAPIAASQVIALAREAMKEALRHSDQQSGEDGGVSNELTPGLTIDLSRKNIQKLPDEVVDIIMNKLERYVGVVDIAYRLPMGMDSPADTLTLFSTDSPCPITSCRPFQPGSPSARRCATSTSARTTFGSFPCL